MMIEMAFFLIEDQIFLYIQPHQDQVHVENHHFDYQNLFAVIISFQKKRGKKEEEEDEIKIKIRMRYMNRIESYRIL